jgi:hypothetical protein
VALHGGDGVAVLGIGLLIVALGDRAILAIADGLDARAIDALGDQIVAGGIGAALAEGEVVFLGAATSTAICGYFCSQAAWWDSVPVASDDRDEALKA